MDLIKTDRIEKRIDTHKAATHLRTLVIDVEKERVLIARLAESEQAQDLSVPANCGGFGRIRHFRRETAAGWPENPLPIDPAAQALRSNPPDVIEAQVFQNAACAWRCWYCFVPYALLAGNPKVGAWLSADDLLDLYQAEETHPLVIDLTGGSPDLSPEWVLWMMRALRRRNLDSQVYLWSDDNLSTDYFWRYLTLAQRREIVEYRMYGRVACFKGFDVASFGFNTRAEPEAFDRQFEIMARLVAEGLDCYAYATFTASESSGVDSSMRVFVDRLQQIDHNLPLRTVPLRIAAFSPVVQRMNAERTRALDIQDAAISAWNNELQNRFSPLELMQPIATVPLGRRAS
ncbi:hypothetical protein [Pseudoxanthomonas sp. UTMC 1351]|uniref:hypothetical protein n=1 Tax=Pseudoxanthomonas sp. UTMC 1351 TaxID=2695853 RepID=UPI0034CF4366